LAVSAGRWEAHPKFAWRAAELIAPRERRILARSLRRVAAEVRSPRPVINASPVNRRGVAPFAPELETLADRLADLDQPVSAAAILLVRELLTDGGSPLYVQSRSTEISDVLSHIRATLEAN
jgi:hypothetical protein